MKINAKTKGILYILTAAVGFSLMTVFVRLSGDLPSFQKAFFRNFIALIFISGVMIKNKTGLKIEKKNIKYLFCRCFFGTLGLLCNFYAVDRLALADANMLNKLSPFFAIVFSVILIKEIPDFFQIAGVTAAFIGALFIIKPGFAGASVLPAVAGLFGGMGAGIAYTFVRMLGKRGENGSKIIFYFSAFSCAVCLPFLIFDYHPMTARQLLCLLGAGAAACVGQIGITRAYFYAPAKEISVYDYSQVVFAALFGFLFFGQIPDVYSIVGYVLICGAGIAMFYYNKHKSNG